ncbi:MAG: chromosome partitioning protein ParA [Methylobacteriaceae bacterium]|nr:chromosome partitioning protein ParA [Methylobacteriaceae bacterium]
MREAPVEVAPSAPRAPAIAPRAETGFDAVARELAVPSLDAIGQRDELVRQRMSALGDRLDEIRTLHDDFASLLGPLVGICEELPRASMRIAELETALAQEGQGRRTSREEAANLARRLAVIEAELSQALARADQLDADLESRTRELDDQRVSLRERALAVENLERQMFAETEQNRALVSENKALRLQAQAGDSALARSENDLLLARERLTHLEQDNRRLQVLSEEQGGQLAALTARNQELETAFEQERQRARSFEEQLAAEVATRERIEAQTEAELAAHRSERSSLSLRLEAANNRIASTEQMLAQAHGTLRQKDEALRMAERTITETGIARSTAERRLESIQSELGRQTERVIELQRTGADLDGRCDMLTKALAAKDAALDQANARHAALSDRLEQVTARHETVRAELEIANRRLSEDLQNERSERALVQGALDIARESRAALYKQYDQLKRSFRSGTWAAAAEEDPGADALSNVRPFAPPGKPAS